MATPVSIMTPNAALGTVGQPTETVAGTAANPLYTVAGTPGANSPTKLEDTPSADGDRGDFVLGVRNTAEANLTNADGDYSGMAVDIAGRSIIAPSAGAFATTALAIAKAEDAPHASGDVGIASLGVRNDGRALLTSTDLDYGTLGLDGFGNQIVRDALLATSDLTSVIVNITTATTTAIVNAGGASVTTRVHRMRLRIAAAQTIIVKDGVTTLETLTFAAAGSILFDFSTRPWYKTTANTALNFTTSTTGAVEGVVEYASAIL